MSEKTYKGHGLPDNWSNDHIQFPRLIAELESAGAFNDEDVMATLRFEMDLSDAEIFQVVERAQARWDRIKKT